MGRNRTWEQKTKIRQMMPELEKVGCAREILSYIQGALRNMPDADEYQKLLQRVDGELHAIKQKYAYIQERDYIWELID